MLESQPIKVVKDRRIAYLTAMDQSYRELGYSTRLSPQSNVLKAYQKGYIVPKSKEELIIEKWAS